MQNSIYIFIIIILAIILFGACDGTTSTKHLELKSEIDGHLTSISFKTNVKGYNQGDVLAPSIGRTSFTTSKSKTINELYNDVKNENVDLEVELIDEEFIIIYEKADDNKRYSYFIRFIKEENKKNLFQAGELRLYIKQENEEKILLFPFHLINDECFVNNHLNKVNDLKKEDMPYQLKKEIDINDFVDYYNLIGWFEIIRNDNRSEERRVGKECRSGWSP